MTSAVEVPSSCTTTEATANPPIAVSRGGFSLAGLKFHTNTCSAAWVAEKRTSENAKTQMNVFFIEFPQGFWVTSTPDFQETLQQETVQSSPPIATHPHTDRPT